MNGVEDPFRKSQNHIEAFLPISKSSNLGTDPVLEFVRAGRMFTVSLTGLLGPDRP